MKREITMETIGVYLGANSGNSPYFREAVIALGKELVALNLTLIYGGSSLGMMGLLANSVKEQGGKVIGVITQHLIDKEIPLTTLDELHIVNTMQERKKLIQTISDAFITMPGGLGTLEEALETWNAIKIGELQKKIAFLNINGYFDGLFSYFQTIIQHGLLSEKDHAIPIIASDVPSLLYALKHVPLELTPTF